jgi:hypothetical protein
MGGPRAPGLAIKCGVEGGKDTKRVIRKGARSQIEADSFCGARAGRQTAAKPEFDVGVVAVADAPK